MSQVLITVSNNVRRYRLKKKLSQQQLAKKAKIHPTYLSRIENAKINIFLTTLFKLARALGVRARDLVK